MSEQSILPTKISLLPSRGDANAMVRMIDYFSVTVPKAFDRAIAAHNLYVALNDLDAGQLAVLKMKRTDIAVYSARATGILKP